ncbi:MAG: hypothetical protein FJ403_23970 [Verrucomicrobia bacterium]|nr:hypothetical protein [Verrucomicrobiota bacterium]
MNLFLDHDVPSDIGRVLRLKGYSVEILEQVLPGNTDDLSALRHAAQRGAVVITCNRRDFLRLCQSEPHAGLIVLIRRRSRVAECAALLGLIERAGENGLRGNINFA